MHCGGAIRQAARCFSARTRDISVAPVTPPRYQELDRHSSFQVPRRTQEEEQSAGFRISEPSAQTARRWTATTTASSWPITFAVQLLLHAAARLSRSPGHLQTPRMQTRWKPLRFLVGAAVAGASSNVHRAGRPSAKQVGSGMDTGAGSPPRDLARRPAPPPSPWPVLRIFLTGCAEPCTSAAISGLPISSENWRIRARL